MKVPTRLLLCLGLIHISHISVLQASYSESLFPRDIDINNRIIFWQKIFLKYPEKTSLIHDKDNVSLVLDVIDFNELKRKNLIDGKITKERMKYYVEKYLSRYKQGIKNIQNKSHQSIQNDSIEKRILTVYSRTKRDFNRLMQGKVNLRSQRGLADEFLRGSQRAQKYLPFIKSKMKLNNIPIQLSSIVFVESMFNLKAHSKVGASGIWQIMPKTAKQYLFINRLLDERRNPYKATEAAIKILKNNYRATQSWPLSITAYNHGLTGILTAMKQYNTSSMGVINKLYNSSRYSFASSNFYAEFLAAHDAYRKLKNTELIISKKESELPQELVFKERVSIDFLVDKMKLRESIIRKYNLGIREDSYKKYRNILFPRGFSVYLPADYKKKIISKLQKRGSYVSQ